MLERGIVVSVADGAVDVAIEPAEACEACGACTEGAGGKRLLEGVADAHGAAVGDTVEVETPLQARRRAQWLVYVVPVVLALAGYLAGFLLGTWAEFAPDAVGVVTAIIAGAAALASLTRYNTAFERVSEKPRVRAIIARCRRCAPGSPGRTGGQSQ